MSAKKIGRVGVLQLTSSIYPQENLEKITGMVEKVAAQGASFICLPEYFSYFGLNDSHHNAKGHKSVQESIEGSKTLEPYRELARK